MSMEIGFPTLLGILLLPAVTFALAYAPIVTHFSRGLISPYAKADVRKRFSAALVDGLVVITLSVCRSQRFGQVVSRLVNEPGQRTWPGVGRAAPCSEKN